MGIQETLFTTEDLEKDEREEAWRETIGTVFDIECSDKEALTQSSVLHSFHLGDVMLTRCITHGQTFVRSAQRLSTDPVDHYLVQLYLDGHSELRHTGKPNYVRAGDIVIHDLADQHLSTNSEEFSNLTCIVPRRLLAPLLDAPDNQSGHILNSNAALTAILAGQMKSLFQHNAELPEQSLSGVSSSLLTLISTAINASPNTVSADRVNEAHQLSAVVGIKDLINAHLSNPELDVDFLSRHSGMSRSKLYRLFAPYGGVRTYVQNLRLKTAVRMLRDPAHHHLKIYQVALACGFKSEAHFSRAFKDAYGISPRDARMNDGNAIIIGKNEQEELDPGALFSQWFQTIG